MTEALLNASAANFSDVRAQPYPEQETLALLVPLTVAYAVIFVAGVVGNVSTCVVIARNRSMHTATNYYLFSLAASDLLLLVCGLPPEVHHLWHPDTYPLGEAACVALGLVCEMSANATVLTITAFTVERYIAICHPFISHKMSKLSRVLRYIAAIWVVALCTALPQAVQFGVLVAEESGRQTSVCTVKHRGVQHAFIISSFIFFVGPMTMITVLYALIGVRLRTSRVLHPPKKLSIESNGRAGAGAGSARYRNGASQRRVIRMLVAVALSFFVCWSSFHTQRLVAVYASSVPPGTHSAMFLLAYKVLTYLSGVLYFLSTAINPFLYSIMSNKFREAFRVTLSAWCGSGPAPGLARTYSALAPHRPTRTSVPSAAAGATGASGARPSRLRRQSSTNVTLSAWCGSGPAPGLARTYSALAPHRPTRTSVPSAAAGATGASGARPSRLRRQSTASTQLTALAAAAAAAHKPDARLTQGGPRALSAVNESPSGSAGGGGGGGGAWGTGVARRLRQALAGGARACEPDSAESARSISNSSLRDVDDEEYTGEELATYMQQVNRHIDGTRVCVM